MCTRVIHGVLKMRQLVIIMVTMNEISCSSTVRCSLELKCHRQELVCRTGECRLGKRVVIPPPGDRDPAEVGHIAEQLHGQRTVSGSS